MKNNINAPKNSANEYRKQIQSQKLASIRIMMYLTDFITIT